MRSMRLRTIVAVAALLVSTSVTMGILLGDGQIHDIDYAEPHLGVDYQLPGLQTTVNLLEMGHVDFLEAFEDSIINVFGGSIEIATCFDNSRLNAYAGEIMFVHAFGNSRANIFGGSAEGYGAAESGIVIIHGSDFAVEGTPVGYVELSSIIGLGIPANLTGTLSNGDPLDVVCDIYGDGQIFLVPEPATIVLLGLGGIGLLWRRSKS